MGCDKFWCNSRGPKILFENRETVRKMRELYDFSQYHETHL